MFIRLLYFLAFAACIFISLLIGGGIAVFGDPRAQIAIAFGIAWAIVESSIPPHQFARKLFDVLWVAAAIASVMGAFTAVVFEYTRSAAMAMRADWVAAVGLAMAVVGLIIRFVAMRTLGEFFSHELKITENHRIVQNGLYRYLRHPSYTGFALICFGIPLVFGAVEVFAMLVGGVSVALAGRILMEEQILLNHFGDEYRAYQKRTKRLIPFVW